MSADQKPHSDCSDCANQSRVDSGHRKRQNLRNSEPEVKTKGLAIDFRDIKGGGIIPRVLSEENCSIYIELPANDRAEHGLR
jgi:hypothetical protein